jgi:hypothetical protein
VSQHVVERRIQEEYGSLAHGSPCTQQNADLTLRPVRASSQANRQAVQDSVLLEMRAAMLGRLSPEALRCVAAIFERRMEEKEKKTLR